ncbi:hypothetical protein B1207_03170 [Legionella quinlivanii]|uniref:NHL repeat protein n=1 Tax=Legionella quinlivanii TaxID=45073 RepID=A0A364LMA6_9GAMM|nr:hypothetical protein [Legionella quinlivanii]RAP38003.1 hypothetical protein B1207_03170 [Legionella quinlivanii]
MANLFISKTIAMMIGTSILTAAYAGMPVWTFTPLTQTALTVAVNDTATVQYQITNQSLRPHTLIMRPIPGVSQVVSSPWDCPGTMWLGYQQSCILNLRIHGGALQGSINGGPILCDMGNPLRCSEPCAGEQLNILQGPPLPTTNYYTVGGVTSCLKQGTSAVLQNNKRNYLAIPSNGPFVFSEALVVGSLYNVTVLTQPAGQLCEVTNGSGIITSNVTNIGLTCEAILAQDSFANASAVLPWQSYGSACLTATGVNNGTIPTCQAGTPGGLNGNVPDINGQGTLRLTLANLLDGGGIITTQPVLTSQGIDVRFTTYSFGGDGADGFSFFLLDASQGVPANIGVFGGGLGYATIPGGYVGIGLDEFGNFSNPTCDLLMPICAGGPGKQPNSIAIRGPSPNNPFITSVIPGFSLWQNVALRNQSTPLNYHITITGSGILNLYINGAQYISNYNLFAQAGAIPATLYFGFSASTGAFTNIHEISNFSVTTFTGGFC